MKIKQEILLANEWSSLHTSQGFNDDGSNIILMFGGKNNIDKKTIDKIKEKYHTSHVISTSTSGEIFNYTFYEEGLNYTALQFEKTEYEIHIGNIKDYESSFQLGLSLFKKLEKKHLKYVFVLSDGGLINGTDLVNGLNQENETEILITGGLAGDGPRFQSTIVGLDHDLQAGNVVVIGFYGDNLQVGHGSLGGWDEFGPERIVTKSENNVLYELDNKNALDLYKQYLGSYADELPGSALLFPLSISSESHDLKNVRTILSLDEENKSMTFAGNLPEGSKVRLMKANFDKIINASGIAAKESVSNFEKPDLSILISCVGRRLILNDRVEEEIEVVQDIFGKETPVCGFYSYGEISPLVKSMKCELQNQTMTITTLKEN
jgi:hypothetical protein